MKDGDWMARRSGCRIRSAMWGLVFLAAVPLRAQTGAPIISTGSGTNAPDPVTLDVAKISTDTDICVRIQKAWKALDTAANGQSVDSGVLDARSITGVEPSSPNCTVDPFLDTSTGNVTKHHGILLLGSVVIQTTVPWQIPSHVWVNGLGDPGSFIGQNTVLQAAPGFASSGNLPPICVANAVLCLGHGTQAFRAQVSNMAIDCNDQPNCIAAYNGAAQEGSWIQGVTLANSAVAGLMVSLNEFSSNGNDFFGAVNSGPYHNVSVQYWQQCSLCSASTAGVLVQNNGTTNLNFGGVIRDFDNFTLSAFNACPDNPSQVCYGTGFLIEGASVNITNSHVEYFQTSVQIGADGYSTNGVEITNMYMSNTNSKQGVMIWKPTGTTYTTGDITISGLNYAAQGTGNSLVDQVGGNTLSDLFIAFYAVGHPSGTNNSVKAKVISTSPNLTLGTTGAGGGGNPH